MWLLFVPLSWGLVFTSFLFRYEEFYPDADKRAAASTSYSRIITPQATSRIAGLLSKTEGKVVLGGEVIPEAKFIAPTVVSDVKATDSLMSE